MFEALLFRALGERLVLGQDRLFHGLYIARNRARTSSPQRAVIVYPAELLPICVISSWKTNWSPWRLGAGNWVWI